MNLHSNGFVNGDTASVLKGSAVCSLEAGSPTDAGSYPGAVICLPGTLSAPYYTIASDTPGTRTITPTSQKVTFTTTKPAAPTSGGSYAVAATSTSGGPITYAIGPTSGAGVCSISGQTVALTAAATCVIDVGR